MSGLNKKRKLLRDLYRSMDASELKFLRDMYDACGGIANPISLEDVKGYSEEDAERYLKQLLEKRLVERLPSGGLYLTRNGFFICSELMKEAAKSE
jgi:Fic family protein